LFSDEELDFINEYERTRQVQSDLNEQRIKAVLEALRPLIDHNLTYLRYGETRGYFTCPEGQRERVARHNALTTVIGRAINWGLQEGRELAFKILEETNDHKTANDVKPYLIG
jgi:formate dehydrogenase assembly factor FdhD